MHAGSGSVAGRRAGCPQIPRLRGPLSPQGPWCPMLSRQESSQVRQALRLPDWPIFPKDRLSALARCKSKPRGRFPVDRRHSQTHRDRETRIVVAASSARTLRHVQFLRAREDCVRLTGCTPAQHLHARCLVRVLPYVVVARQGSASASTTRPCRLEPATWPIGARALSGGRRKDSIFCCHPLFPDCGRLKAA